MSAQCPSCGRFAKAVAPKTMGEGYSFTYCAQAECSRCGVVAVGWEEAYGEWDPESD